MRRPVVVLLGVCAAAVVVLLVSAMATKERRAFTLGVAAAGPVTTLQPRQEVCEEPVVVPDSAAAFDRVAFSLGTFGHPGPPIDVRLSAVDGGFEARGRLPGGYADVKRAPTPAVPVGHVAPLGEPLRICLRNAGTTTVSVYGNGDLASRTSTAVKDGKLAGVDVALVLERNTPRSALSLVPAMFRRASLWRADWVGAWTYWVLGALVLLALPALLAVALRSSLREP
jgi:hypothetical protein